MTHARSFEEVIAERTQTLDMMRATIERMRYLIDLIATQITLEHQYSNTHSDSQPPTVELEDRSHG
ncbi:hypothetical protein H6F90_14485 [Trichocoleus sp. FACHB-591]|uniref:hypothetical protein n=1 Tax=Trichocoleus sp. FACHB-591 TaxID=2692872 RepID=UPI0016841558|nr:hypothetical protein [Trichocoleus sp. FACHB-591]MBD2096347.1 hypothetical protein [Trichocoleus sp. FACHB-591]